MTRRELIEFLDSLVELAGEGNKAKAILVREQFLSSFEKSYEYEEVFTEVSGLPPHYVAEMPGDVQEEIRKKVTAALTEAGECTLDNIDRAMASKIHDLEALIDVREYIGRIESEQKKKGEQERRGGR